MFGMKKKLDRVRNVSGPNNTIHSIHLIISSAMLARKRTPRRTDSVINRGAHILSKTVFDASTLTSSIAE